MYRYVFESLAHRCCCCCISRCGYSEIEKEEKYSTENYSWIFRKCSATDFPRVSLVPFRTSTNCRSCFPGAPLFI